MGYPRCPDTLAEMKNIYARSIWFHVNHIPLLLGYLYLIDKMHDQATFKKELILAYDSKGIAKICNSKQGGNR